MTVSAPLPIDESATNEHLVQPASAESVSDDTSQIAVVLQLSTFLCNPSNGQIKNWTFVVSENSLANGLF